MEEAKADSETRQSGLVLGQIPWRCQDFTCNPVLNVVLGARRSSMGKLLGRLESEFGSIAYYLDWIGFDATWRGKLRRTFVATSGKLMAEPNSQVAPQPLHEHLGGMGAPSCAPNADGCASAEVDLKHSRVCRL